MASEFEARLKKRDEERKAAIEKRREEKNKATSGKETQDYFIAQFTEQKNQIDDLIFSLSLSSTETLKSKFDEIATRIATLRKLMADSKLFLPPHTVKTYQEKFIELQLVVREKEEQLLPKQKFSFKSRKKETVPSSNSVATPLTDIGDKKSETRSLTDGQSAVADDTVGIVTSNTVEVKDKTDDLIRLQSERVNGNDINITSLSHCTVHVIGSAGTIHISKCNSCKVLSGPVQRSVFIEDCIDCSFVVACQQLRVHTTSKSVFYLHVISHPIIEDSTALQFASYNLSYPGQEEDFLLSGLSHHVNNWDQVNDFNWLSGKEHSPNWSLLPESQRCLAWDIN